MPGAGSPMVVGGAASAEGSWGWAGDLYGWAKGLFGGAQVSVGSDSGKVKIGNFEYVWGEGGYTRQATAGMPADAEIADFPTFISNTQMFLMKYGLFIAGGAALYFFVLRK